MKNKICTCLRSICSAVPALIGVITGGALTYYNNKAAQNNAQKYQEKQIIRSSYPITLKNFRNAYDNYFEILSKVTRDIDSTQGESPLNNAPFQEAKNDLIFHLEYLSIFLYTIDIDIKKTANDFINTIKKIDVEIKYVDRDGFKNIDHLLTVRITPYLKETSEYKNLIIKNSQEELFHYIDQQK